MIIPMLSLDHPTPLNISLPCLNLAFAQLPFTQTGIAFWREAAAAVTAEWGGPLLSSGPLTKVNQITEG